MLLNKIFRLLSGFIFLSVFGLAVLPLMAREAVLTVDAADVRGPISPYVLGANYGAYGVVPPAQFETAALSGVKFFRFPGGAAYDEDGLEINFSMIDLFMVICKQVDAEPSIQVKLFEGDPEKAAALVRYVNIDRGYNVRYWYIGNEPSIYDGLTTDEVLPLWRTIAEAMLAVDPNIILIGPDVHQYPGTAATSPKDPGGKDWMDEFLKLNGDMVDIVSIHRYPFPIGRNRITTIDDLRNNAREWETIIPFLRDRVKTLTGAEKPVAVTEINSHWSSVSGGAASPDSLYNAIWFADVLGRLIRQQVEIVAYFEFYGADGRPLSLIDRYGVRPTYYTYQLYKHFGTELIMTSPPDDLVTIYAAKREDGTLTLIVVNLADDEQSRTLELKNFTPGGEAEVFRLDAEHNAESTGTEAVTDRATLTLPGQSVTLYVVPAG